VSADFRTEHFKGWQHDGYVHVARVDAGGQEYPLGDLTAGEVAELASMFPASDPVTIPRDDFSTLLTAAAILASLPAADPARALRDRMGDLLARYDVHLEVT